MTQHYAADRSYSTKTSQVRGPKKGQMIRVLFNQPKANPLAFTIYENGTILVQRDSGELEKFPDHDFWILSEMVNKADNNHAEPIQPSVPASQTSAKTHVAEQTTTARG